MNTKVYDRAINTLQCMMDNSKIGDELLVYEDGDQEILPGHTPKGLLYANGTIKVPNDDGVMLLDWSDGIVVALGARQVYNYLEDAGVFEVGLNCSQEQLDQVTSWLKNA